MMAYSAIAKRKMAALYFKKLFELIKIFIT